MKIKPYFNSPLSLSMFKTPKAVIKRVIKRICVYLYTFIPIAYLLVLFHFLFRKRKQYKYKVSLCLIFKNEARFLREWVEYHRLIGVEHFYLYNNFSEDNYREVLRPYVEQGIVTLTEWPYKYAQVKAYEDCYDRFKDETQWLGYIDADEFVNLLLENDIKQFLSRFRFFPSVLLRWKMFGTSGFLKEESDSYLVIERYTAAWPHLCQVSKSFINCDYGKIKIGIHLSTAYIGGFAIYGIDEKRLFSPFAVPIIRNYSQRICLNHYWSKSRENYLIKDYVKGEVANAKNIEIKKTYGRFELHELNNSVHDYSIQRWLVLLKERLMFDK